MSSTSPELYGARIARIRDGVGVNGGLLTVPPRRLRFEDSGMAGTLKSPSGGVDAAEFVLTVVSSGVLASLEFAVALFLARLTPFCLGCSDSTDRFLSPEDVCR